MQIRLSKQLCFWILLFLLLINTGTAVAFDIESPVVGWYDTPGFARGIAVSGNYAYIADWANGLVIVDVSNPSLPTLVERYDSGSFTHDVAVSGNYAYVTDMENGLLILDISIPSTPTLAGRFSNDKNGVYCYGAYDVTISGNYAYIAYINGGLSIVNISNPSSPTLVGRYSDANCYLSFGATVLGNYAYVTDIYSGLIIIDISNPSSPTLKGSYYTGGEARAVTVSGKYAYVVVNQEKIVIVDISNPSSPTLASIYSDQALVPHGVLISGNYAYVAEGLLSIVDISNPSSLTVVNRYTTPDAENVAVSGDYIYVAAGGYGLFIVHDDTNNPPVANTGGPYQTTEGSAIIFDASASSDPDGDALQYRWDFESDGTWTEWSNDPRATHTWNDDWSGAITLEVRDSEFTSTAVADVTVTNANPIVETGNDQNVNEGTEVIFSGNYNDAGTADIHTIAWDFGDSSTASDTLTPTHVYADNGEYTVTLTVTDNDGGVGTDTLTVTVNNVNPVVGDITSPLDPHEVNTPVSFSSTFTDVGILDTHTAVWDFGDGTTAEGIIVESKGAGTVTGEHPYANAGIYWVTLTATDDDGGSTSVTSEYYIVIYDPEGGFVTGGGWIDSPAGSYVADPALTGKATFGFVSKYKKGATVPTGNTEFQFKVANLNFKSISYDWLVVAGAQAKYKGTGTINGAGNYGFMLSAVDGAIKGDNVDKFRIKIWDKASGEIVYDNQIGVSEDAEPTTAIGGGSIVVHKVK